MKRKLTHWLASVYLVWSVFVLFGCAKNDPASAVCLRNLQEIGFASRVFEATNGALPGDFQSLLPYLSDPRVLVCPAYASNGPVAPAALDVGTITYAIVRPGLRFSETNSVIKVFVRCPKHGYFCQGDGSVHKQASCETVP